MTTASTNIRQKQNDYIYIRETAPGNLESDLVETVGRRERRSLEQTTRCQRQGGARVPVARVAPFVSPLGLLGPTQVVQTEEVHRHSGSGGECQVSTKTTKQCTFKAGIDRQTF